MNARIGLAFAMLLCVSCGRSGGAQRTFTTPGPEATDLVARTRGALLATAPVGGIESLSVPDAKSTTPRRRNAGLLPVRSVAGPDVAGRIAFVENDMLGKRHALKLLMPSGDEVTIFAAPGDALWEHAVGKHLALDARGQFAALVARAAVAHFRRREAYCLEGELEVWSVDERQRVAALPRVLDDTLGFFPGGERLVYAALVERAEALALLRAHVPAGDAFCALESEWERIPVAHEFDVATGRSRPLHVGERPVLSPDGKLLLVCDRERRWRLLDIEAKVSRAVSAPGAIYPGAIDFVDAHTVLYWAWPTEGAPIRFTEHNSPLAGPKQMRALKLFDLRDGRFQTVKGNVDPRDAVSFGP